MGFIDIIRNVGFSRTQFHELRGLLIENNLKLDKIMAEQSELAAQLQEVTAQVAKISTETAATLQKVTDLEAALDAADDVSPEVQAAFDALKSQVQQLDDQVPDVPVTP